MISPYLLRRRRSIQEVEAERRMRAALIDAEAVDVILSGIRRSIADGDARRVAERVRRIDLRRVAERMRIDRLRWEAR